MDTATATTAKPDLIRYNRKSARRSVFHTAVFRALSQAATFASYIVLVRALPEHDFGVLNLLYALIPLISTVASLGIEQTLRRFQPEYLQAGNMSAAAWLVRMAASARFLTSLLVLAAILLTWDWVAPQFQLARYHDLFTIFCVLILLHFQASIIQLALSSHMLQGYSVGGAVTLALVKLAGYLILIAFGRLTLLNAILVDLVAYVFMYAGLRIAYVKHCRPPKGTPPFKLEPQERKRLLRYSIYNNFNDAGTLLLTSKSDNFFIAALVNPVAVGAYAFYGRLSEMTSQLLPIKQFSNVIVPLFFAVPPQEAPTRIPRYFTLLLNLTMIVQLPITAYLTAYHRELVQVVFGGKFLEFSWLLPVISGFATINRMADPVIWVAQYDEKVSVILWSKLFGLYNAAAMLALVPIAGIYGAAIATGSAQAMKNLYIWWHVRDKARWTNFWYVLTVGLLLWGGIVGVCYLVKQLVAVPPVVELLIGAVLCTLGALVYMRTAAIATSDRELLGSVMHGKERRILSMIGLVRGGERKEAAQ